MQDEKRNRRSISQLPKSSDVKHDVDSDNQQLADDAILMDVNSQEMVIGGIDDMLIETKSPTCFSPFLVALSNFVIFSLATVLLAVILVMKKETRKTAVVSRVL